MQLSSVEKCQKRKVMKFEYGLVSLNLPGSDHVRINKLKKGSAAYQLGNTSSRTITEVKQRRARLVLG